MIIKVLISIQQLYFNGGIINGCSGCIINGLMDAKVMV